MGAPTLLVSVVVPAFNEVEVLPYFHRALTGVLAGLEDRYRFEIVYVDDGSTDATLSLLRCWAGTDTRVRYLSLSRNFGHQAAFTAGLESAGGDAVVLMDCDLQHPPALLPALLDRWREGHDLVLTLREGKRPGPIRGLMTRCFVGLLRRLSATPLREQLTDFCLLSRRAADSLRRLRESHRYLRGLVQWLGYPAAEVVYEPPPRRAGRSRFTPGRLLAFGLDAITSSSRLPLRLSFALGLLFVVAGLVAAGGVLAGGGAEAALLASVYLVGGTVLTMLGVVGEYVGRTFEQVQGRPLYLLKETDADLRQENARRAA